MSFESELIGMDAARLQDAVTVISEQVRAGRNAAEVLEPTDQAAYVAINGMGDMWRDRLLEDASGGLIDPETAWNMVIGARLAIGTIVEYAKADTFERENSDE